MRFLSSLLLAGLLASPAMAFDIHSVPENERPQLGDDVEILMRHETLPKDVAKFFTKARKLLEAQKLEELFLFALHPKDLEEMPDLDEVIPEFRREMGHLWTAFVLAPEVPCYTVRHPTEGEAMYFLFREHMRGGPGEMALQQVDGKWKLRDI